VDERSRIVREICPFVNQHHGVTLETPYLLNLRHLYGHEFRVFHEPACIGKRIQKYRWRPEYMRLRFRDGDVRPIEDGMLIVTVNRRRLRLVHDLDQSGVAIPHSETPDTRSWTFRPIDAPVIFAIICPTRKPERPTSPTPPWRRIS